MSDLVGRITVRFATIAIEEAFNARSNLQTKLDGHIDRIKKINS
jgi:hypothetical protein